MVSESEPFEVLYRRLSEKEANLSVAAGGLRKERAKFPIHDVLHQSEPFKWLAKNRNWVVDYFPNGTNKDAYSHLLEIQVVPGTIDALSQLREGGKVQKGPRSSYGVPLDLVEWFNKRILSLKVYDLSSNAPELTHNKQLPYYLSNGQSPLVFVAFDQQYLAGSSFSEAISLRRMTWLKTSLLWMLQRSDWGKSSGQGKILEIAVPETYLTHLSQNAVSTKESPYHLRTEESPQILFQRDPDRAIWGRNWSEGGDKYWLRANTTVHFGIRGPQLNNFVHNIAKGNIRDITDVVQTIEKERIANPTRELYATLKYSKLPFRAYA